MHGGNVGKIGSSQQRLFFAQIDLRSGSKDALWQWFCAAILFGTRIKSKAGVLGGGDGLRQA